MAKNERANQCFFHYNASKKILKYLGRKDMKRKPFPTANAPPIDVPRPCSLVLLTILASRLCLGSRIVAKWCGDDNATEIQLFIFPTENRIYGYLDSGHYWPYIILGRSLGYQTTA